jgi:hypothetical protein
MAMASHWRTCRTMSAKPTAALLLENWKTDHA